MVFLEAEKRGLKYLELINEQIGRHQGELSA